MGEKTNKGRKRVKIGGTELHECPVCRVDMAHVNLRAVRVCDHMPYGLPQPYRRLMCGSGECLRRAEAHRVYPSPTMLKNFTDLQAYLYWSQWAEEVGIGADRLPKAELAEQRFARKTAREARARERSPHAVKQS